MRPSSERNASPSAGTYTEAGWRADWASASRSKRRGKRADAAPAANTATSVTTAVGTRTLMTWASTTYSRLSRGPARSSRNEPVQHRLVAMFHGGLGFQARVITADRRDREGLARATERDGGVARGELPGDVDAIPSLGVPDVVDRQIVVRAPEE